MSEVWTAIYWVLGVRQTATFRTEEEARDLITDGEIQGTLAAEGIQRPDKTFYPFRGE